MSARRLISFASSWIVSIGATSIARAQTPVTPIEASGGTSATEVTEPRHEATEGEVTAGSPAKVTPFGYVEASWQWNFNRPSNGITNYRGFDNRTGFTLDNVVLGASFEQQDVIGKISFQVGHTPATYYLAEPTSRGTPGAASTDATYWRLLQEAHVGWKAPIGDGLLIEGGLFLSPIGVEGMAITDQWNWSRSNLFFGLPFYHVGARATYPLTSGLAATLAAYNGWNDVVDDNDDKSVSAQLAYASQKISASLLYFGGNERPGGAPEGRPWRHLWDAWITVLPTDRLGFTAHGDVGFEKNAFGTSSYAGAIYARVKTFDWLFVAARADYFHETIGRNGAGAATPIFWPSKLGRIRDAHPRFSAAGPRVAPSRVSARSIGRADVLPRRRAGRRRYDALRGERACAEHDHRGDDGLVLNGRRRPRWRGAARSWRESAPRADASIARRPHDLAVELATQGSTRNRGR